MDWLLMHGDLVSGIGRRDCSTKAYALILTNPLRKYSRRSASDVRIAVL